MKRVFTALVFLCFVAGLMVSCDKKSKSQKIADTDSIFLFVDEAMRELYLWNDKMTIVDWRGYSHPDKQMADMLYLPIDRWSHVYSKADLESFFTGESVSFGFMPIWMEQDMKLATVYKNSEAYRLGLRRGMQIKTINNTNPKNVRDWDFFINPSLGESIDMEITTPGRQFTVTIHAADIIADQVLHHEVIAAGEKKAGYIVYESFAANTKDSLIAVMEDFRIQGATELIIDLRYNGGGDISVLIDWMNKIMPARFSGKPFIVLNHNRENRKYNEKQKVYPDASSLGIERVFVISTGNTASASEALINGLKPYIEVHQIGEQTHGKPVGMYVMEFQDWYVIPIAFEYTNAKGEGGFYNGIRPEQYASDDVSTDWGDKKEQCLAQALHYIEHGSYSGSVIASSFKSSRQPVMQIRNLGLYSRKNLPLAD